MLTEGERDERVVAQLAKGRMRVEIPELTEALTATSMPTTPG